MKKKKKKKKKEKEKKEEKKKQVEAKSIVFTVVNLSFIFPFLLTIEEVFWNAFPLILSELLRANKKRELL